MISFAKLAALVALSLVFACSNSGGGSSTGGSNGASGSKGSGSGSGGSSSGATAGSTGAATGSNGAATGGSSGSGSGTSGSAGTTGSSGGSTGSGTTGSSGAFSTLALLAGQLGGPGNADGTGAAARFFNPSGLALDGAGNLYVADSGNDTIRKVAVASATVSTLAGVPGRASVQPGPLPAALNLPAFLAFGPGPSLYLSDPAENAILWLH